VRGVRFTVHGHAQPAGSKKPFAIKKDGKTTGQIVVVDANSRSKGWKSTVAEAAAQAADDQFFADEPLELLLTFYVPRPKSHYGTGANAGKVKASARGLPTVKPDCTKLLRGVEDAMTGVVYRDDAQIVAQTVTKRYGTPERVEVAVLPVVDGESLHDRVIRALVASDDEITEALLRKVFEARRARRSAA
jgi:Holliday junction resolvase RusA-like endonuclease